MSVVRTCGALPRGVHPRHNPGVIERTGPLSWAQRWHWLQWRFPAEDRMPSLPVADYCEVPSGLGTGEVETALAAVVARHEALRTTVSRSEPRQFVHADHPRPRLTTVDVESEQYVEDSLVTLLPPDLDLTSDVPWRAQLLCREGVPKLLLVAVHHLMADGAALGVVLAEAAEVMNHLARRTWPTLPPAHHHPVDQALADQQRGADVTARAVDHRMRTIDQLPHTLLARAEPGRHHTLWLQSERLWQDVRAVSARCGESTAQVLLAAWAKALSEHTGSSVVGADVVVSNRSRAAVRSSVGVHALLVPVRLTVGAHPDFDDLVQHAAAECLHAYRFSHYDPLSLTSREISTVAERGAWRQPLLNFNFHSTTHVAAPSWLTPLASEQHSASTAEGACDAVYVDAHLKGDAVWIWALAGDHLLSAEGLGQLATRTREILADDPPVAAPAPESAHDWVWVDRGWVHPPSVERVLRTCSRVADAAVFPNGGGDRLIAYVVPSRRTNPAQLRRSVLDALAPDSGIIAPHWYVLCDRSPAHRENHDSWRELTALDEGHGVSHQVEPAADPAEEALLLACRAVHSAHDATSVAQSYAENGYELDRVPALLDRLDDDGWTGLSAVDFLSTESLRALARRLEP